MDTKLVKYQPVSELIPTNEKVPVNLKTPIEIALKSILKELKNRYNDENYTLDRYIFDKLEYGKYNQLGFNDLAEYFSAEQIDALTLAIFSIEKAINKGKRVDISNFLLADMTGIGKGRVLAGVIRYTYLQGKIPIFVSDSDNLFSDIYRDINDIGGLKPLKSKTDDVYLGKPFIFNSPTIIKIEDDNFEETVIAETKSANNNLKLMASFNPKKELLPDDCDLVLLTYSQLSKIKFDTKTGKLTSKGNSKIRWNFIEKIISKSVLILDESHKATGSKNNQILYNNIIFSGSNTSIVFKIMAYNSLSNVFSSATFSKSFENLSLYMLRSLIVKYISAEEIESVIRTGGIVLQEYLTSLLAEKGELMRREKSFENCKIEFLYEQLKKEDTQIPYEYSLYDTSINTFNNLVDIEGVLRANTYNYAEDYFKTLYDKLGVLPNEVISIKEIKEKTDEILSNKEISKEKRKLEIIQYLNNVTSQKKLVYNLEVNKLNNLRQKFIKALIFAIKTKKIVDYTNEYVKVEKDYKYDEVKENTDGTYEVKTLLSQSLHKVLVAIEDTNQSALEGVISGYKDMFDIPFQKGNSFYYHFIYLLKYLGIAELTYANIDEKWFNYDNFVLKQSNILKFFKKENTTDIKKYKFVKQKLNFSNRLIKTDVAKSFIDELGTKEFEIPFSPIDEFIDRLKLLGINVLEFTGRTLRLTSLKHDENGGYYYDENECMLVRNDTKVEKKEISDEIAKWNNDETNNTVIIFNSRIATGVSMHSSSKFKNKMPRALVFWQIDLAITTQIQKRGRVYRTGQVNYPTYLYIISKIPSEIRQVFMFMKKLRNLDATTSANQKTSMETEYIYTKDGKMQLHDVINKYGDELARGFINKSENYDLKELAEKRLLDIKMLKADNMLLSAQFLTAERQEEIYNQFNMLYDEYIKDLKAKNRYDLEVGISEYEASNKSRQVLMRLDEVDSSIKEQNNVYANDYYTTYKVKTPTKEQIREKVEKIYGLDFDKVIENYDEIRIKFLSELEKKTETYKVTEIEKYETLYKEQVERINKKYDLKNLPKEKDKEKYEKAKQRFLEKKEKELTEVGNRKEQKKQDLITDLKEQYEYIKLLLNSKEVMGKVGLVNEIFAEIGYFVGLIYKQTTNNPISDSNFEFVFATLQSGWKNLKLSSPTAKEEIRGFLFNEVDSKQELEIEKWIVKNEYRYLRRILTGNLLLAYQISAEYMKEINASGYKFVRFTDVDNNSISGIELLKGKTDIAELSASKSLMKTYINEEICLQHTFSQRNYQPTGENSFEVDNDRYNFKLLLPHARLSKIYRGGSWYSLYLSDYPDINDVVDAIRTKLNKKFKTSEFINDDLIYLFKKFNSEENIDVRYTIRTSLYQTVTSTRSCILSYYIDFEKSYTVDEEGNYNYYFLNDNALKFIKYLAGEEVEFIFEDETLKMKLQKPMLLNIDLDNPENFYDRADVKKDVTQEETEIDRETLYEIKGLFKEDDDFKADYEYEILKSEEDIEKSKFGLGFVKINKLLTVSKCIKYNLVPVNLTTEEQYDRLMKFLTHVEIKKYINQLNELNLQSGDIDVKKLKAINSILSNVQSKYYIFGIKEDESNNEFLIRMSSTILGVDIEFDDFEEVDETQKRELSLEQAEKYMMNLLNII